VDYLRPGPDEDLIAESQVLRVGNRVAVVNTRVYSVKDAGTIIAEGKAVYNIRRAGDLKE
jgi:acyl-coenzyme A thioesterase PaaI-like protein